jgi:peptide/nickel transport system substrate-binding protein
MRFAGAAPTPRLIVACVLALAAALMGAGCGEEDVATPAASSPATPGPGGALAWALAETPDELDPLLASTRADQLVTRQIHEPLVETLAGPFGDVRRLPGLSLSANPSAGDTIWSFAIRPGVEFQDGTPVNAGAVQANGTRWLTTAAGRALMPDLFAVDAPRPDLVRFFLEAPDPDFPDRLGSPRTGIVSPRAMTDESGMGASLRRDTRTGTGPFELRESETAEVLVARNLNWWGTDRDLGPALDQVRFRVVADPDERLALLSGGDVQLADALGPEQARAARREPLLDVRPGAAGTSLGLERSVRGITSGREIPSLSGVWVTRIGEG